MSGPGRDDDGRHILGCSSRRSRRSSASLLVSCSDDVIVSSRRDSNAVIVPMGSAPGIGHIIMVQTDKMAMQLYYSYDGLRRMNGRRDSMLYRNEGTDE